MAKIDNTAALKAEIKRLKTQCRQIESSLDQNFDQLRENFGKMAFNSIIGNRVRKAPVLATAMGLVAGAPWLKKLVLLALENFLGKKAGLVERILTLLLRKR